MKKAYLGIDAHKEQNTIAIALAGRGDPELYGKAPADVESFLRVLRRLLAKYGLEKEDVSICYEAGPTGFVLARRLRALGFECEVAAPSLIPVKASDRVKTDRRDARKLAGLFRAGELTFVHVPDVADEVIRDVCRGRTDAAEVRGRARQQRSPDGAPCASYGATPFNSYPLSAKSISRNRCSPRITKTIKMSSPSSR